MRIMTYEEFLNTHKKYDGAKCFVANCDKPAYYEGGDARFYCGMCEEHAGMKRRYEFYLDKHRPPKELMALFDTMSESEKANSKRCRKQRDVRK